MLAALFLFLAADQPLAIVHCSDTLSEMLRAQVQADEPITVTCDEHVVLVSARGRREVFRSDRLEDSAIAYEVMRALAVLQSRPVPVAAPRAPEREALRTPEVEAPFKRSVEIWIEPLGSIVAGAIAATASSDDAIFDPIYVAAGVTVDLVPHWELVSSFGLLVQKLIPGDDSNPSATWALWVSAAPVHLWHYNVGGPRSGFFLGPKLTVAMDHSGAYTWDDGIKAPAQTAFAIELGYEAGFRFQFARFDMTLTVPSASIGYEHNRNQTVMNFPGTFGEAAQENQDGLGIDFDLNLIRLGVNF